MDPLAAIPASSSAGGPAQPVSALCTGRQATRVCPEAHVAVACGVEAGWCCSSDCAASPEVVCVVERARLRDAPAKRVGLASAEEAFSSGAESAASSDVLSSRIFARSLPFTAYVPAWARGRLRCERSSTKACCPRRRPEEGSDTVVSAGITPAEAEVLVVRRRGGLLLVHIRPARQMRSRHEHAQLDAADETRLPRLCGPQPLAAGDKRTTIGCWRQA